MSIHLLVPFYRKHLYKTLTYYYGQMKILFHPICDSVDIEPFKDNKLDWVKPLLCPSLIPGQQCYKKFNDFIDLGEIILDDYYGFCGDDDMFEPEFFSELSKRNSDVVYNSNYRGDKIPNDGAPHGVSPLIIRRKEDVFVNNIGLGMFFVKGHIFKTTRFDINFSGADGRFAEDVLHKGTIDFMSNSFVFGNYFQPGRHTDRNKFL